MANVSVKLDSSNYATKPNSNNATGVDTLDFTEKTDLASLKFDVDKLNINKLKDVPRNLSNMESKVGNLDVDKLVPDPVDLSKLDDVLKKDVVKKTEENEFVKIVNNINTTDTANWVKKPDYDTKISEILKKYWSWLC